VTFEGQYETVTGAGLAPMPLQQPVPIWLGGSSPAAYRRAGRVADGWFPQVVPGPQLDAARAQVAEAATAAGRDPSSIGMEGRVTWGEGGVDSLVDQVERWRAAGATHLAINTMGAKLGPISGHLDALARAADALGLSPASR
jgi:alkanesulfonate monooxygenase SsuD/methylene tetrahydromethanopterin reductase-like flavin-dependent oxidoreductase (luciferase family)